MPKSVSLYSLGEGSTFRVDEANFVTWVVTKHDPLKVEFDGDVMGFPMYYVVNRVIASKLLVTPISRTDPTNHKKIGNALKGMKSSPGYLPLSDLPEGSRALAYFSSLQDVRPVRIDRHSTNATWLTVYHPDGTYAGKELVIATKEVLRL